MAIQSPQQGIINNQLTPPIKPVVEPTAQPVQQAAQPTEVTPPADQYKAPTVQPITTQVDVPTETVESRLSDITAKGSRYTDLAKADAIRQANTRGLINTTMAGAAGTEAAIRAALPIAQQDAKTFVDTRMMNQQQLNEFLRNRQSANLNLETAAQASRLTQAEAEQASGLRVGEMAVENQLNINRDINSAALNEQLSSFESTLKQTEMTLDDELRTGFETTIQDARFSDEAKMQIVTTMNNIIRDTQEQITQVGMSDRTAEQQVSAINMIQQSRDAELAVYQDLLSSFNDWEWSTEFTPKTQTATPESVLSPKPTEPPPPPPEFTYSGSGDYAQRVTDNYTSDDGLWRWNGTEWVPSR